MNPRYNWCNRATQTDEFDGMGVAFCGRDLLSLLDSFHDSFTCICLLTCQIFVLDVVLLVAGTAKMKDLLLILGDFASNGPASW